MSTTYVFAKATGCSVTRIPNAKSAALKQYLAKNFALYDGEVKSEWILWILKGFNAGKHVSVQYFRNGKVVVNNLDIKEIVL